MEVWGMCQEGTNLILVPRISMTISVSMTMVRVAAVGAKPYIRGLFWPWCCTVTSISLNGCKTGQFYKKFYPRLITAIKVFCGTF